MSALVDSTRSARPSQSYCTTGRAGLFAGLSRNSIKALLASGELVGRKTKGGHWRIKVSSLVAYVEGVTEEEIEQGKDGGVVVYVRVSSEKQKASGSLDRQLERLLSEVEEREGIKREEILVYSECASSFGRRPKLYSLVDNILSGGVSKIFVEYLDRLSRVGSELHLLRHLAESNNVEIVALDANETNPDESNYLAKELLAFITVICNKSSAFKSRVVTFKALSEDVIRTLFSWMGEGLGLTAIYKRAKEEGLKTEKGEPLSYYKIREVTFNGKSRLYSAAVGSDDVTSPTEILQTWLEENLVESEGGRVFADEVLEAYRAHCRTIGIEPLYPNIVGKEVSKIWEGRRFKTSRTGQTGIQAYRGLALKET